MGGFPHVIPCLFVLLRQYTSVALQTDRKRHNAVTRVVHTAFIVQARFDQCENGGVCSRCATVDLCI